MRYFVIPAWGRSTRFPNKCEIMFPRTANILDYDDPSMVIVSSDSEKILEMAIDKGFQIINRDEKLLQPETSTRDILIDVAYQKKLLKDDIIVMLYVNYPERTADDLARAQWFFHHNKCKSMLCKMDVLSHPFLCMYGHANETGIQIVKHNLNRHQDYPNVFEISHFIAIMKVSELKKLNNNLYNKDTKYFHIPRTIDIDYKKDYDKFLEGK